MGEYEEGSYRERIPPEIIEALNRIAKESMQAALQAAPSDTIDEMDLTGPYGTPERMMRWDVWIRDVSRGKGHLAVRLGGDTSMPLVLGMTGNADKFQKERGHRLRNPFK